MSFAPQNGKAARDDRCRDITGLSMVELCALVAVVAADRTAGLPVLAQHVGELLRAEEALGDGLSACHRLARRGYLAVAGRAESGAVAYSPRPRGMALLKGLGVELTSQRGRSAADSVRTRGRSSSSTPAE